MRKISFVLAAAALYGCSKEPETTRPFSANTDLETARVYTVRTLPSLGGNISRANAINALGWEAGYSNLPGDTTRHAVLWVNDAIKDLGTFGGPNSDVAWPGINNRGQVVGFAETAVPDSLGEAWSCAAFFPTVTNLVCRGFFYENGVMTQMPTLGGTHSFATGVNGRGQAVGWAETTVHDPTCHAPQVLQFRAVLWDPKSGKLRQLRPLPGDSTSAATAINDHGQAVGISGKCDVAVGDSSAEHSVLWENGTVTDIGNFGGTLFNTPMDINERGDIVGLSDFPGDTITHAFLWTRAGGIKDLGTLPGDTFSQANAINTKGQIVGISCGTTCRAFIYQNGVMTDLNTLVAPGFADQLYSAQDITEAGVITGRVLELATGRFLAFVAK